MFWGSRPFGALFKVIDALLGHAGSSEPGWSSVTTSMARRRSCALTDFGASDSLPISAESPVDNGLLDNPDPAGNRAPRSPRSSPPVRRSADLTP